MYLDELEESILKKSDEGMPFVSFILLTR